VATYLFGGQLSANKSWHESLGVLSRSFRFRVGSLKEAKTDILSSPTIIDRTKGVRKDTFFGEGNVAHVGFADPVCASLSETLYDEPCRRGNGP
jgi:5'-methylthioadenosine phosphorylase